MRIRTKMYRNILKFIFIIYRYWRNISVASLAFGMASFMRSFIFYEFGYKKTHTHRKQNDVTGFIFITTYNTFSTNTINSIYIHCSTLYSAYSIQNILMLHVLRYTYNYYIPAVFSSYESNVREKRTIIGNNNRIYITNRDNWYPVRIKISTWTEEYFSSHRIY